MKSFAKKALSVIVALTMIFSVATTNVSAAKEFGTVLKDAGVGVVGFIVSTLLQNYLNLTGMGMLMPCSRFAIRLQAAAAPFFVYVSSGRWKAADSTMF